MGGDASDIKGPDLERDGIALAELRDGTPVEGHAGGEPVLVVRAGDDVFAVGARCTHYSGPLAEGLVVGETVRCPWHHACFSLRTGEALAAPALNPLPRWEVARRDGRAYLTGKHERDPLAPAPGAPAAGTDRDPASVVIVGAGAAGAAAAEMLRRRGYAGPVTVVDGDPAAPYDRPNLSKDYLAGSASPDWIPLRPPGFYEEHGIELRRARAAVLDAGARRLTLDDGAVLEFGALILATGAEPVRLDLPGMALPHVHVLRSLADSEAIMAAARNAKRAVVIGASFIGLEVAASLRARGLSVDVVAPDTLPLERVLGAVLGAFVRDLHAARGVAFHLGRKPARIDAERVTLDDGAALPADLVVAGVGVRPRLELAQQAGLVLDRGVAVNEFLETSSPGVFAAGDIARWPDRHTGASIRVEHWVVAERQGQFAARNVLHRARGEPLEPFDVVPFFWSAHYDASIRYVGHAERWDHVDVAGDAARGDCSVAYRAGGRTLAVASVGRDLENLRAELALERDDEVALRALFGAPAPAPAPAPGSRRAAAGP
jgi:NADPH-dependent 2,4-dienoyl-CoA reductase/sulfur reductase-like enzyme/nitrite reductase/ring-hydroxylating ferredoxin subunit